MLGRDETAANDDAATCCNHDTPGQVEGVPISCTGVNETKTKLVPGEIW